MSDLETSQYPLTHGPVKSAKEAFLVRCLSADELRRRERWTHHLSHGSALTAFIAVIALVVLQSSGRRAPPSTFEYVGFYLFLLGCAGLLARLIVPSLRPGWYRPLDHRYHERLDTLCSTNHQMRLYCARVHSQKRAVTKGEFVKMRRWAGRHSLPEAQAAG
jgi:hypothetical protein